MGRADIRPSITVCVPARNEEATVGFVVRTIRRLLIDRLGLVEEVMVVDDRSTDDTARIARRAGARVVSSWDVCRWPDGSRGKGDALWTSIHTCTTDLIGWVDADLHTLDPARLIGLFEPLRTSPEIHLVKGSFERFAHGRPQGPGRVTALTAKPLIRLLFPELLWVQEPLGGLFAGRVSTFRQLDIESDYGVDVGVLLDVATRHGVESIAEVNLGVISHRNRELGDLSRMADQVARTILSRARIHERTQVEGLHELMH
jgi:glucosyl-3-phosphoglycerate synthase